MSNEAEMVKPQMQQKMDVVKGIQERIQKSSAFYIAKYDGVNVESITELRRELRKAGSELNVLKNKLLKRAIADEDWSSNFDGLLTGPNATAFAYEDGSATAKVLFDFAKKNKALEIKGCLFDGQFFGPDKISIIKDLPTRDQLLGMVASVINEPMAKIARTLGALQEQKEQ